MKIMTYEKFIEYYEKNGKAPNQMARPKNPLNDKQLESLYERYSNSTVKANKRSQPKIDNQSVEVNKMVDEELTNECQLILSLDMEEFIILKKNAGHLINQIDHAHVFGKGANPHMKYMPKNITLLNRYSHSMMDTFHNPITGEPMTPDEHEHWWKIIVGTQRYEELKEIANG